MSTKKKPLLLFFSVSGVVGGVEVYICKKWIAFNKNYRIVCVIGKPMGIDYLRSMIPEVEVIQFPFTSISMKWWNLIKVIALLLDSSASIIHSNDIVTSLWAKVISSFLFWKRIANVTTIHSVLTEHHIFSARVERMVFLVFRFLHNVNQFSTICVSKQVFTAMKALRFTNSRSVVIYHGVDSIAPKVEMDRLLTEKVAFAVVFVGRLSSEKGPDIFVDVINRTNELLSTVGTSGAIQGIMFGEGKQRRHIESLLRGESIKVNGFVQDPDLIYGSADVVCITSRTESFSFVLFESLARRVPVFALRLPVFEEIIAYCPYGNLMLCKDIDEMARKIIALKEGTLSFDFQRLEGLLERFSKKHEIHRVEELYNRAILGQCFSGAYLYREMDNGEAKGP